MRTSQAGTKCLSPWAGRYVLTVVYVEDKAGSAGSMNFGRTPSRRHALVCAVRRATMACTLATRRTADDFLLTLNWAAQGKWG
jgi:hypothetical protein